jgi:4-hydroxy-tetrahydrodipicolinate synthase
MGRTRIPCGIQNAPEFLGVGLSPRGIADLARAQPNFRLLKGEAPATLIARVVAETDGLLPVMNGRAGLELPDNFRAGCSGIIPAADCLETQVAIWQAMQRGNEAEAERLYRAVLPAIVFVMQGIDHLVCYGKRLVAARLGLGRVYDRAPGLVATPFGEAAVARFAAQLGPLPAG